MTIAAVESPEVLIERFGEPRNGFYISDFNRIGEAELHNAYGWEIFGKLGFNFNALL